MSSRTLIIAASLLLGAVGSQAAAVQSAAFNQTYFGVRTEVVDAGLEVSEVWEGSPAAKAGLKRLDVITAIGGTRIRTISQLTKTVSSHSPGEVIQVTYLRGDVMHNSDVTLGRRPGRTGASRGPVSGKNEVGGNAGWSDRSPQGDTGGIVSTSAGAVLGAEVENTDAGLRVTEIHPHSPGGINGLQPGDIVKRVNGTEVEDAGGFSQRLRGLQPGTSATVQVVRKGEEITLDIPVKRPSGLQVGGTAAGARGATQVGGNAGWSDRSPQGDTFGGMIGVQVDSTGAGPRISRVQPGGPAANAGIQQGDIVKRVNGTEVEDAGGFSQHLRGTKPGASATVQVNRGGQDFTFNIPVRRPGGLQVGGTAAGARGASQVGGQAGSFGGVLGVQVENTSAGPRIIKVQAEGPAATSGIQQGDIVKRVNGTEVEDAGGFSQRTRGLQPGTSATVEVVRNGQMHTFNIPVRRPGVARTGANVGGATQVGNAGWSDREPQGDVGGIIGVNVQNTGAGPRISRVEAGGPAANAGLQPGDIVKRVNGTEVEDAGGFSQRLRGTQPGASATVEVVRNGSTHTFNIPVNRPGGLQVGGTAAGARGASQVGGQAGSFGGVLGVQVENTSAGPRIIKVQAEGPAATSGIQQGDIVKRVNGTEVEDAGGFSQRTRGLQPGTSATVEVVRNGQMHTFNIPVRRPGVARTGANVGGATQVGNAGWSDREPQGDVGGIIGVNVQNTGAGPRISRVEAGGPAADAGLQPGDIVKRVNGTEVEDAGGFSQRLRGTQPGASATVEVVRNGSTHTFNIPVNRPGGLQVGGTAAGARGASAIGGEAGAFGGLLGAQVDNTNAGPRIIRVQPNGPAANSGIQQGDIVSKLNGTPVVNAGGLSKQMSNLQGSQVHLTVLRNGREIDLPVVLASMSGGTKIGGLSNATPGGLNNQPDHGCELEPTGAGLRIVRIRPGSAAEEAGLQPGDIIKKVGGDEVDSAASFSQRTRGTKPGASTTVEVERNGQRIQLTLPGTGAGQPQVKPGR